MKNRKKTTTGAQTDAERGREDSFKRELKNFFPEELGEINFTYSSIKLKHDPPSCWEREGAYGYFMKESILIGGQSISIAWLPHVKDMTDKQISYMAAEVASCIKLEGENNEGTTADQSESGLVGDNS